MASLHTKIAPKKSYWVIEGYDSTTRTYAGVLPGNLSEGEIVTIVQRLASRHLTEDEIVAASLRKGSRIEILQPLISSGPKQGRLTISISLGCDYIASHWRVGESLPKSIIG